MLAPMNHRSIFGLLLALVLGVLLAGGGCANGNGDNGNGQVEEEGGQGDATTDGAADGACGPGKTACGGSCTSLSNDPKNCGKCGSTCNSSQVCTSGMCSYSCSTGETLCNAPPEAGGTGDGAVEAGKDAASDASGAKDAATDGSSGAKDASAEAAAADAGGGDGGAPYCANTNTDNDNCGACGNACGVNHVCNGGICGLSCPSGQQACIAGNVCIPDATCCSSAQCPITGQICPQPGSTCQCPSGETACSLTTDAGVKYNSCISSNDCCTNADCASVAGSTCPTPGQACVCANGQKACLSQKTCLPTTDCCIPTDCGPEPGVGTYTCGTTGADQGQCGIATCTSGCYDLDGVYSDGCECCDDTIGKSCTSPTGEGTLSLGQVVNVQGQLPGANESDWVQVTFSNESTTTFHANVTFTSNPNNEFVFDIASDCSGTLLACGDGGDCQAKTQWEVYYQTTDPPLATGTTWAPIPAIGTVNIRVYRASTSATPTCDQWALSITE
jgi:hypothetical protein